MFMYTVRKEFQFEAAHQLSEAWSRACVEQIHGHSYRVEVFLKSYQLNPSGMVVDFGLLSAKVEPLIEAWDHSLLLHEPSLKTNYKSELLRSNVKISLVEWNPTAENMARFLFTEIKKRLTEGEAWLWKVRVHETASGWAEYMEYEVRVGPEAQA